MFHSVDGGRSSTSQGVRRPRFTVLMVDAPGPPVPAPPKGLTVDIF
jgi:hypothetical protein